MKKAMLLSLVFLAMPSVANAGFLFRSRSVIRDRGTILHRAPVRRFVTRCESGFCHRVEITTGVR